MAAFVAGCRLQVAWKFLKVVTGSLNCSFFVAGYMLQVAQEFLRIVTDSLYGSFCYKLQVTGSIGVSEDDICLII